MNKCNLCNHSANSKQLLALHTFFRHSKKGLVNRTNLSKLKTLYRFNEIHICEKCKKPFEIEMRLNRKGEKVPVDVSKSGRFCSKFCANSRCFSEETRKKRILSLKKVPHPFKYIKKIVIKNCFICTKPFSSDERDGQICCSTKCGSIAGGRIASRKRKISKRSLNEIYFSDLCKEVFSNVLCNESIFNGWDADVIIPDLKVAVLWNGIWHYEKLFKAHSLIQVQNRDRIKIGEIKKAGYVPYVVRDPSCEDSKFVVDQFISFLYFLNKSNLYNSFEIGADYD